MSRFAIRGLLSRKLRTALTAIAIVLGVAMISGTYVLTDSIDQAFDRIFNDIRKGSSAVITGKSAFDLCDGSGVSAPTFDESLLAGGARASRRRRGRGQRGLGRDAVHRRRREGGGLRRRARTSASRSPTGTRGFNPLTLVEGAWPRPDEVVVDKATAGEQHFEVGETIGVQAEGPVERLRVSGIVQFSSGLTHRRGDSGRLRPADRAAAVEQARAARRDRRRSQAGRHRA